MASVASVKWQIHFNFRILPKWLTVVHAGMLQASVTVWSCFLREWWKKMQLKIGRHHFQLRCTPWQLQLYPPPWLSLDDVRLTSMLFSQISCIVRRTHRWNFSKGNVDKAWNYHDTAFQQAAVISAGNIQLPRVQVSKHYNHPWNCVKDNFLCPHIHTSASFSHHHIVPITSRNSFCTSHFFASLSARGSTAWVQCADWSYLSSQTPGKWHSSGAPIGDNWQLRPWRLCQTWPMDEDVFFFLT